MDRRTGTGKVGGTYSPFPDIVVVAIGRISLYLEIMN